MKAYIKYIDYYLPERIVTNKDLEAEFPEWNAEKVAKKTGISERHIVADNMTATDMAYQVALKLFDKYPEIRKEVDFLLLCTQSPDYKLPTSACLLQKRLGLSPSIGALDYNLGCSGWVYGLAMAKGLIASGVAKNVLLITSETYSKYFHPKDKGNKSLFGDGAAATYISTEGKACIGDFVFGTDGTGESNLIVKSGGSRFPAPLGDEGFDENGYILASDYLYMNGPEIFNFTLDVVPSLIKECIERNNLFEDSVDLFVLHQANKYMLETVRKVCRIQKEKFYINIEKTGNTVSSTIPIALKEAWDEGLIENGKNMLVAGFGVGYSYGACMLKTEL